MKENTIINDLNDQEYHSRPEISKHGLDVVHKCPAMFKHSRTAPKEDPSPAMLFGSLAHLAVLEPDKFESQAYVLPKLDRRTKEGKAEYEYHQSQAIGKTIISQAEKDQLDGMVAAIKADKVASNLLYGIASTEASLFWTDPVEEVECRARLDAIRHDGFIVDYKTCDDASQAGFSKSVFNFRYHVQAAYYCDALELITGNPSKGFIFLAQEKKAPYLTAIYTVPTALMELGRKEYKKDLETYAKCLFEDQWPGYTQGWTDLVIPSWLKTNE
jgi:exodeoxyribonuclease VIII